MIIFMTTLRTIDRRASIICCKIDNKIKPMRNFIHGRLEINESEIHSHYFLKSFVSLKFLAKSFCINFIKKMHI